MNQSISYQAEPPQFYGRESEIAQIISLATQVTRELHSHVLLIQGPGGIGKSMLLRRAVQELREYYPEVHCVGPIDLDDTNYRIPTNTGWKIAQELGADHFAQYFAASRRYQRMEFQKVDQQTVLMHMNAGDKYFVADYIRYATDHRVAIFADTIESMYDTYMWTYFMRMIAALPNTLFVLAGRPALSSDREAGRPPSDDYMLDQFRRMPFIDKQVVKRIQLVGWPKSKAREFIRQTELGERLPDPWVENLLHLSRCQPLHLTLAIERLQADKMPILEHDCAKTAALVPLYQIEFCGDHPVRMDELEDSPPDVDFAQLSEKGKELQKDFERSLVFHYAGPDTWAEVIRRMSHVRRRLNRAMYEQLMAFEPAVQDPPPWEILLQQPWIRPRAGEYVTLHDIVSELVKQHVWPMRDPEGHYRRQLSRQAITIYDGEIGRFRSQLNKLSNEFDKAAQELVVAERNESSDLMDTLRMIVEINRQLRVLEAEWLYYQFDADVMKGYSLFIEMFDQAGRESRVATREMLLLEAQGFLKAFSVGSPEYYEIRKREAQTAIDEGGMAEKAGKIISDLLTLYRSPQHQYELLRLQANANIRIPGRAGLALDTFFKALRLTQYHDELREREAESLMEIGWAYRQLGRWKQAAQHYTESRAVTSLDDFLLRAQIENGLAYVEALVGAYTAAETLIHSALTSRRRWGDLENIGISLSVAGEIYRYQRRFTEAKQAYQEALTIFSEQQNSDWIGQVQQQMAIALVQEDPKANLEEAKYYADSALYLCQEYNARAYPSALNRAARVYSLLGKPKRALELLEEGIEVAQAVKDAWFLAANCVERAELLCRLWSDSRDPELRARIFQNREIIDEMKKSGEYTFQDLFGRWHLVLGHVAWCEGFSSDQEEHWQEALEQYKIGFPFIAEGFYGSHGIRALPYEGGLLRDHVLALPRAVALNWCRELNRVWGEQKRSIVLLGIVSEIYDQLLATEEKGATP